MAMRWSVLHGNGASKPVWVIQAIQLHQLSHIVIFGIDVEVAVQASTKVQGFLTLSPVQTNQKMVPVTNKNRMTPAFKWKIK
jgi:hypothetical protein